METKPFITLSVAVMPGRSDVRFQMLQKFLNSIWWKNGYKDIKRVYICPDAIVIPYNKDYMIVAFDYETLTYGWSRTYITSHFHEKISLN